MQPTRPTLELLLVRALQSRDGRLHRRDSLFYTRNLRFALALVENGIAEPNDAATAEAIELGLRLRRIARERVAIS